MDVEGLRANAPGDKSKVFGSRFVFAAQPLEPLALRRRQDVEQPLADLRLVPGDAFLHRCGGCRTNAAKLVEQARELTVGRLGNEQQPGSLSRGDVQRLGDIRLEQRLAVEQAPRQPPQTVEPLAAEQLREGLGCCRCRAARRRGVDGRSRDPGRRSSATETHEPRCGRAQLHSRSCRGPAGRAATPPGSRARRRQPARPLPGRSSQESGRPTVVVPADTPSTS